MCFWALWALNYPSPNVHRIQQHRTSVLSDFLYVHNYLFCKGHAQRFYSIACPAFWSKTIIGNMSIFMQNKSHYLILWENYLLIISFYWVKTHFGHLRHYKYVEFHKLWLICRILAFKKLAGMKYQIKDCNLFQIVGFSLKCLFKTTISLRGSLTKKKKSNNPDQINPTWNNTINWISHPTFQHQASYYCTYVLQGSYILYSLFSINGGQYWSKTGSNLNQYL